MATAATAAETESEAETSAGPTSADVFEQAQSAASEGRYDDVIRLLTTELEAGTLDDEDVAVALSNRGIAYSLIQEFELASADLNEAIRLMPDHTLTLNHLGILAEHVTGNYAEAAAWYQRAADLGYAASLVNLGNLYRHAKGVEQNLELAVALYRAAVDQGYAVALVALGEMYMDGRGVQKDYARGLELLRSGVANGVITGHYYLGLAFARGEGVQKDYAQAHDQFYRAAAEGHAGSQGELGYLYRRGFGVEKSFVEAARWYGLAAEQGDVRSSNRLAWLLATCPVEAVCNARSAVDLAEFAVGEDPSSSNLDTLAAAYARLGDFDRSIEIIRELLKRPEHSDAVRRKYFRRLESYQNGIPFQL